MKTVFKILKVNKKGENISFIYITEKKSYEESKDWLTKAFKYAKELNEKDWALKKAMKTNFFEKELNELEELQKEMRQNDWEYFDDYEEYIIQEVFTN